MSDYRFKSTAANLTTRRVVLVACLIFILPGNCMGQEHCGAEAKLLLATGNAKAVAQAFHAGRPSTGQVFLYDTETRDLLAHGIILRVRLGENSDVTVKLRLRAKKAITASSGDHGYFKCEVDYAGGLPAYSYSERTKLKAEVPKTGVDLSERLNKSQRQVLNQSDYVIDWKNVKRVADIQSSAWTITNQPTFDKLDLELWEWPGGAVLELSTKADPASLQATYDQLRSLATSKGLLLNSTQQFKTEMVLRKASK